MNSRKIPSSPLPGRRRGFSAILAMLFIALFSTLAVAMLSSSSLNSQSSRNLADVERARSLAEAGLRWQAYRFRIMPRPKTLAGTIDAATAASLWPSIKSAILTDYTSLTTTADKTGISDQGVTIAGPTVALDLARTQTFRITVAQNQADPRQIIVTSTGTFGRAVRKAQLTFTIDKKVRFAVVGKVPIQIGRNTLVEGNIAMAVPTKYPPILMPSDLTHFDATLKASINAWYTHLGGTSNVKGVTVKNHNGYDNRINVNNPLEYQLAVSAGYSDVNGDGYIDEYDLLLRRFDYNGDNVITASEFTNNSTRQSYEANLLAAIDSLGAPMSNTDPTRLGYLDGQIDNYDAYAKVRGSLTLATTESAWASNLASQGLKITDMIQGAIAVTNPTDVPVTFGASTSDLFDLDPANFETCAANFRARTGAAAGTSTRTATAIENTTLATTDANATAVTERTPYGSTSWQATYQRPVFRNMRFKNVIIPKGLNALFDNCTFEGVTFVDTERNITKSDGKTVTTNSSDGMSWSQRMIAKGATFNSSTALTPSTNNGAANGNNLRFNDCNFKGPLAGNYATAYTHFANSWEFTGKTLFDNQVDQTATIVSPQVNIEMGSFSDPAKAPSTLIGVIVAGNIDIRGYSAIDGSIIVTGDGAGNTTLGYFGPSDGDTNPTAMPEGGYGKINIRYNPTRTLPDGINVAVDILPAAGSYTELTR